MSILLAFLAALELVSPVKDETVALIPDCQRSVLTNEEIETFRAIMLQ